MACQITEKEQRIQKIREQLERETMECEEVSQRKVLYKEESASMRLRHAKVQSKRKELEKRKIQFQKQFEEHKAKKEKIRMERKRMLRVLKKDINPKKRCKLSRNSEKENTDSE